jgi:hypothetical protein
MYKISNVLNKEKISLTEFNSETAKKISKEKLYNSINELLDEYISF